MILLLLWSLTFMICQGTTNYKEGRIVVRKPTYIIFVISYMILLLDFVTLSHVWFLKFKFDFDYIYIMFIFIFILYRLLHLLYTFIHTFILYTFIFIFIIITSHCLHNVCICCLAIYSLMNSPYHIQLSHSIAIFDICHHYLWDLSYICMMSIIW